MARDGQRTLPQNLDAERGLLGIILERNDALFEVSHLVTKADFIEANHGEQFTLMRDMIEAGRQATPTTVLFDVAQDADIGGIMTSEYLATLMRDAPPVSVARDLAKTISDLAGRRRLIELSDRVADEAYSAPGTITFQEIEARYNAAASALFSQLADVGVRHIGDVGDTVLERVADAARREVQLGIDPGLKGVKDLFGSLLGGRMYVLAGAPGAGKSALAWQIARHVAEDDPVLFESLEMGDEALAIRGMSAATRISGDRIERAVITPDEFAMLHAANTATKRLKLWVDRTTMPTMGAIRGKAMRMKRQKGLALLVVDHLFYVKRDPKIGETEGLRANLQAANQLADDLNIPVLMLAPLKASYASEQKAREPNEGDVNAGVESEADVLALLYREEYMLQRRRPAEDSKEMVEWQGRMDKAKGKALLLLAKRRHGGTGQSRRTMGFDGKSQTFTDTVRDTSPIISEKDGLPF